MGADGDSGAPTYQHKIRRQQAPWEVQELVIREYPPSTLKNVNGAPLGGAGVRDPGALTFNAKKTSMTSPLRGAGDEDLGPPTVSAKKRRRRPPRRC
jgi:hypothetical protein